MFLLILITNLLFSYHCNKNYIMSECRFYLENENDFTPESCLERLEQFFYSQEYKACTQSQFEISGALPYISTGQASILSNDSACSTRIENITNNSNENLIKYLRIFHKKKQRNSYPTVCSMIIESSYDSYPDTVVEENKKFYNALQDSIKKGVLSPETNNRLPNANSNYKNRDQNVCLERLITHTFEKGLTLYDNPLDKNSQVTIVKPKIRTNLITNLKEASSFRNTLNKFITNCSSDDQDKKNKYSNSNKASK